jgi:hypothetical protein
MADAPTIEIPLETVCFIIVKAREFDAKDVVTDPDPGSNDADDDMISVLEDHKDDPVVAELVGTISALNDDEQIDLITLAWLGRGTGTIDEWDDLHSQAAEAHSRQTTPRYLLGLPLLADYLAEGLDQLGLSCEDIEAEHL